MLVLVITIDRTSLCERLIRLQVTVVTHVIPVIDMASMNGPQHLKKNILIKLQKKNMTITAEM